MFVSGLYFLAASVAIFTITMRQKAPVRAVNLFEMVKVKDSGGREVVWLSSVASAASIGGMMVVALLAVGWLLMHLGQYARLFFALWTLAWSLAFVSQSGLVGLLRRRSLGLEILGLMLAGVIGLGWVIRPTWLTYSLVGLVAAYLFLAKAPHVRFTFLVVGLLVILGYDVWGVFTSGIIIQVATQMGFTPPAVMMAPPLADGSIVHLMGMGDVILSGVAIKTAARYRLHWWAIVGYSIGLALLILVISLRSIPLPAMLLLSPCILVAILTGSTVMRRKLEW
jgi:hypothetical protein